MAYSIATTLKQARTRPQDFLIIHYSSQSLFDEVENQFSPRITSIVAMFFASRQTVNFSLHAIAEEMGIDKDSVEREYSRIEAELLSRFFKFSQGHAEKCWLHWNMRNTVFGFEHLEHRYRVLLRSDPPTIPFDNRINISDVLKYNYGSDFAPDPRMLKLMEMNGRRDPRFMTGAEEASAFQRKEFIRMNSSTISKVEFFRYVIDQATKGRLATAGKAWGAKIDRALESRSSKVVMIILTIAGVALGALPLFLKA